MKPLHVSSTGPISVGPSAASLGRGMTAREPAPVDVGFGDTMLDTGLEPAPGQVRMEPRTQLEQSRDTTSRSD